jgi:hypothetical protein
MVDIVDVGRNSNGDEPSNSAPDSLHCPNFLLMSGGADQLSYSYYFAAVASIVFAVRRIGKAMAVAL